MNAEESHDWIACPLVLDLAFQRLDYRQRRTGIRSTCKAAAFLWNNHWSCPHSVFNNPGKSSGSSSLTARLQAGRPKPRSERNRSDERRFPDASSARCGTLVQLNTVTLRLLQPGKKAWQALCDDCFREELETERWRLPKLASPPIHRTCGLCGGPIVLRSSVTTSTSP
jgi:hypothetical protein